MLKTTGGTCPPHKRQAREGANVNENYFGPMNPGIILLILNLPSDMYEA